jgi:hypothetical protein
MMRRLLLHALGVVSDTAKPAARSLGGHFARSAGGPS